jgi:hypothetical protein
MLTMQRVSDGDVEKGDFAAKDRRRSSIADLHDNVTGEYVKGTLEEAELTLIGSVIHWQAFQRPS